MTKLTTPISLVESHFNRKLEPRAFKGFDEISENDWIDFAKQYRARMTEDFPGQFLEPPPPGEPSLRLYFEPRIGDSWETAVTARHEPTPLLGISPHPPAGAVGRDDVSRMLRPLTKHLLLADSVYVRDSFYSCFDLVADNVDREHWRQDPNVVRLVDRSIRSIKGWLPILIELRELIESKALVFMPYYLTPSFPYAADAPALKDAFAKIRLRAQPTPSGQLDETEVLGAWLNARLLHLDPVFPDRPMFDWAANLYFDEGPQANDLTSDLISLDILPFGGEEGIALDDLISLRRNEDVFKQVQLAVGNCKTYIEQNFGPDATREGVSAACRSFLQDSLDRYERKSVLKWIDRNPIAGIGYGLALGAALLPLASAAALIAGAVLTPSVGRVIQARLDPTRRALGRLQALL